MIYNISPMMPDDFNEKLEKYVSSIKLKKGELDRRASFKSMIMEDIFQIKPEDIEFEKDRIDLYYDGVMFETKAVLNKETRMEAYRELNKYLMKKPDTRKCVITDGILFEIYNIDTIKKYDPEKKDILTVDHEFKIDMKNNYDEIFNELFRMLSTPLMNVKPEPERIVKRLFDLVNKLYSDIEISVADNIKYKAWKSYISIVFGDPDEASEELFKKQSILYYIVVLITARVRHIKGSSKDIIKGIPFEGEGILNFVDADNFFDIFSDNDKMLSAIEEELSIYDFSDDISEEVFRNLYENLVSPNTRHNLGEFYTPSWLAKILVDDVLSNKEELENKTILDPSCGSGTFIRLVMEKAKELGCNINVVGFDINPIAIVIARANYLIAKKDDIFNRTEPTTFIKIFLADALMPEWKNYTSSGLSHTKNMDDFEITAKGNSFVYVDFNEIIGEGGRVPFYYNPAWDITAMENYINSMFDVINGNKEIPDDLKENESIISKIRKLSEEGKDHVWAYILKNIYTPYYYRNKINIVIGNPPWLGYRDVKNPLRQNFLDKLYTYYNMKSGSQNKSNQDMVGFFICRSKEFLKDVNGKIAFVVTRSVMNAAQYNGFRRGEWNLKLLDSKNKMGLLKIWDITNRANPFNKPSCMILLGLTKNQKEYNTKPISGYVIDSEKGIENNKEIVMKKTEKPFYINTTEHSSGISITNSLNTDKASYYKKLFKMGANIRPRPYLFVDIIKKQRYNSIVRTLAKYGIEKNKRTSKGNFNFLFKDDYVSNLLLYDVILGGDIEKFKVNISYNAVIPIIDGKFIFTRDKKDGGYIFKLMEKDDLLVKIKDNNERNIYFNLLNGYEESFNNIEKDWEVYRGDKFDIKGKYSAKMSVWDNINFENKLLAQYENKGEYMVVYNASGKGIRSAVIHKDKTIIDFTAYYYNTKSKEDAYFICGVLNSTYPFNMLDSSGLLSERHINKTPFELPIPKYNAGNPIHKKISDISYEISELKKNNNDADSKISELGEAVEEFFNQNTNDMAI